MTKAPQRRARRLAQQLHQRLCLEVEVAAAAEREAAEGMSHGGEAGRQVPMEDDSLGEGIQGFLVCVRRRP